MRHRGASANTTHTARPDRRKATRPAGDTACTATYSGALLDLSPDTPLVDLKRRVQAAFREARGPKVIQHKGGRHHVSLGYAYDTADSDSLQSALRRISPSHATFNVTQVHLLDVVFHARRRGNGEGAWEISWDHLASIPLSAG